MSLWVGDPAPAREVAHVFLRLNYSVAVYDVLVVYRRVGVPPQHYSWTSERTYQRPDLIRLAHDYWATAQPPVEWLVAAFIEYPSSKLLYFTYPNIYNLQDEQMRALRDIIGATNRRDVYIVERFSRLTLNEVKSLLNG